MAGRAWSEADLAYLASAYAGGVAIAEIASHLGRSIGACQIKAFKIGVQRPEGYHIEIGRQNFVHARGTERHRQGLIRGWTPERRAIASEKMRAQQLWRIGTKRQDIEKKRAALRRGTKARVEKLLGWCLPSYRPAYRKLCKRGFRAADARQIIEADMARDLANLRRALAAIAAAARAHRRSFAGQMERVAAGAALVPAFRAGRMVDQSRSLIGNSGAML